MPTMSERRAGPPRRMIIRIAVAAAFIFAAYLTVTQFEARGRARELAARDAIASIQHGRADAALRTGVEAREAVGDSRDLSRAVWGALMAGGGREGAKALLKRSFAYAPQDPHFQLMFSNDSRFLAAIDGNNITVWNVEDGSHVLTASAGDRFIGYWRIGARHFGLLASYQFLDLVNSVIELPDRFKYAQPAKDQLTGVAPGGDWAYFVPQRAGERTDYPIKLIDLHTSEKREVDANYRGIGAVAVNADATRIADQIDSDRATKVGLWDARTRRQLATIPGMRSLYFSRALNSVVIAGRATSFFDSDNGRLLFTADQTVKSVADDLAGKWFAAAMNGKIYVYRGVGSVALFDIAQRQVRGARVRPRSS